MKDSIYNDTYKKELADLQSKLQIREREAENVKLKASIEIQRKESQVKMAFVLLITISIIVVLAIIYFVRKNRTDRITRELQHKNMESELSFLRAQVNPHFFFNSINTVYFLIQSNTQKALDVLLRLANLMRFQLYECKEDKIPIDKELQGIRDYVDLEKIRKGNRVNITLEADEVLAKFSIAPFIIMTFVENAFKHVSNHKDAPNEIMISFEHAEKEIIATFRNTISAKRVPSEFGGIGLKNVKRRLELLYPQKHRLFTTITNGFYESRLTLSIE